MKAEPVNLEIEQALLSALLVDNRVFDEIAETIEPDYFADPLHGNIYQALRDGVTKGETVNALSLKEKFNGSFPYIAKLQAGYMGAVSARQWAETIRDLYQRRTLLQILDDYRARVASEREQPTLDHIEYLEAEIGAVTDSGSRKDAPRPFLVSIDSSLNISEAVLKGDTGLSGITTGFEGLDDKIGGLEAGHLYILAARPGMGKTALMLGMALRAAEAGHPCLLLSLEMTHQQIATRALAAATAIPYQAQTRGPLTQLDWSQLTDARAGWHDLPLFIDDEPGITPQKALLKARAIKRKHGLAALFIDYLQLMRGSGRFSNRVEEVTQITQELKRIAKLLEVPVIAMAQLSRALEQREDKRPHLSDLRESGSIEQDADCVMFIFREEYYLARERPKKGLRENEQSHSQKLMDYEDALSRCAGRAEIIIAKQRNGPLGQVYLTFDGRTMQFKDD